MRGGSLPKENYMKSLLKIFFIPIAVCSFIRSTAQTTDSTEENIHFKISATYNSSLNLYGRIDSLKSSGFFPTAEIWFSKNFYVSASPVFINNSMAGVEYAGTIASAGLQFVEPEKYIATIYAAKPFYKGTSQLPQSALKAQAGASFSKLNKLFDLTVGAELKFSDKTDYGVTGGIDHLIKFKFPKAITLVIAPSAYIYAGTQQFSVSYLKKTPGSILFPGTEELFSEDVKKFNILAYEFSIPVVLSKGKWQAVLNPSYIIPENIIASEKGKHMFYVTATLKFTL